MSTDIYGARVIALEPEVCKVQIRVFLVYYDGTSWTLPLEDSFFFRLLADPVGFGAQSPLLQEITEERYFDEKWVNRNAYRYIEHTKVLSTKNYPPASWDMFNWSIRLESDRKTWQREEELVQGDVEVTVTDAKYLEGLFVGKNWESTTAYDSHSMSFSREHLDYLPNIFDKPQILNPFEQAQIAFITYSNDGKYLFVQSDQNELVVYQAQTFQELWRDRVEAKPILYIGYDSNEDIVWLHYRKKVRKTWKAASGESTELVPPHMARLASSKGTHRVNFEKGKTLNFVGANGNKTGRIEHWMQIKGVAFNPSETMVVLVGSSDYIDFWDITNKRIARRINLPLSHFLNASFDPTGRFVAFNEYSYSFCMYDWQTDQIILHYPYHFSQSRNFNGQTLWSPDGQQMLVKYTGEAGNAGHIEIFDIGLKIPQE